MSKLNKRISLIISALIAAGSLNSSNFQSFAEDCDQVSRYGENLSDPYKFVKNTVGNNDIKILKGPELQRRSLAELSRVVTGISKGHVYRLPNGILINKKGTIILSEGKKLFAAGAPAFVAYQVDENNQFNGFDVPLHPFLAECENPEWNGPVFGFVNLGQYARIYSYDGNRAADWLKSIKTDKEVIMFYYDSMLETNESAPLLKFMPDWTKNKPWEIITRAEVNENVTTNEETEHTVIRVSDNNSEKNQELINLDVSQIMDDKSANLETSFNEELTNLTSEMSQKDDEGKSEKSNNFQIVEGPRFSSNDDGKKLPVGTVNLNEEKSKNNKSLWNKIPTVAKGTGLAGILTAALAASFKIKGSKPANVKQ